MPSACSVMTYVASCCQLLQHGAGSRGLQPVQRGRRDKSGDGGPVSRMGTLPCLQQLTDGRGADRMLLIAAGTQAGQDVAIDAGSGQFSLHNLIIEAGDGTERFFTDIAAGDAQNWRYLLEQRNIQSGMAAADRFAVFLKVAGESRLTDDIGTTGMENYIGQIRYSCLDQLLANGKREQTAVLTDEEEMEHLAGGGGLPDIGVYPTISTRFATGTGS